jgi:glycosyltransferase involved in cell wall biosynthesis
MSDATGGPAVWLLSAYRADSHAAWADWLTTTVKDVDWHRLELPGRHFRWRIRGNPLSWLDALPAGQPDGIIATSMVDLATLRGLHPGLARVPATYYFHENQFAYPVSPNQVRSVEPQIVQVYGALAADRLVFNSRFNRDSFLDGAAALIRRMPDCKPDGVRERLAERARVLPVPIRPVPASEQRDPGLIVWNHRWEYDKVPELFADAMEALAARGVDFRLALLGWRPAEPPQALQQLRERLRDRIIADGRVPAARYRELLGSAGVAVSTARHEFQGLAMLEAVSAGARPLVPDDLCYPEQYPSHHRYGPGDCEALVARLADWLQHGLPPALDVADYGEDALRQPWRRLVTEAAGT